MTGALTRSTSGRGAAAAVLVAAVALGAVGLPGCSSRTNETSRAAGIVPADAVAFVSASLDPSVAQKRNLLGIIRKFPKARDKVQKDFTQTRDKVLSDAVKQACLDYARDVKPWLGSEVAIAVLPDGPAAGAPTTTVLLLKVKDAARARRSLTAPAPAGCATSAARARRDARIVKGFAVVATSGGNGGEDAGTTGRALDAISAQATSSKGNGKGGLAKAAAFTRLERTLHGDRLLLAYVAPRTPPRSDVPVNDPPPANATAPHCDPAAGFGLRGRMAFDLHVGASSVVLDAAGDPVATGMKVGDPALTRALPATTTGVFTTFDAPSLVRAVLACTADRDTQQGRFTDETGLDLEADVVPWMGGETMLVAGPPRPGRSSAEFALVVQTTDHDKASVAADTLKGKLADQGGQGAGREDFDVSGGTGTTVSKPAADGTQPAIVLLRDRLIVATSPDFARALAGTTGPHLGDTVAYHDAIGAGSGAGTQSQLVFDVAAVRDATVAHLSPADRAAFERDVEPELAPLATLGVRSSERDGVARIELKLSLK